MSGEVLTLEQLAIACRASHGERLNATAESHQNDGGIGRESASVAQGVEVRREAMKARAIERARLARNQRRTESEAHGPANGVENLVSFVVCHRCPLAVLRREV